MKVRCYGGKYYRIEKRQARRFYKTPYYKYLYFAPCKMRPDAFGSGPWAPSDNNVFFDKIVNEFEFYNCNFETGYYTAFYIPIELYVILHGLVYEFSPDGPLHNELKIWEEKQK